MYDGYRKGNKHISDGEEREVQARCFDPGIGSLDDSLYAVSDAFEEECSFVVKDENQGCEQEIDLSATVRHDHIARKSIDEGERTDNAQCDTKNKKGLLHMGNLLNNNVEWYLIS